MVVKLVLPFVVFLFAVSPAFGEGKYSEVKIQMNKLAALLEATTAELNQVSDAGGAAAALNKFAAGLEEIAPTLQALEDKYPEINPEDGLPDELKPLEARTELLIQGLVQAQMKVLMEYGEDPGVREALERLDALWD